MSRPFPPADRALGALLRALAPHLGRHRLIAATSRDWASATFMGARHRLAIALEGADARSRATVLQTMLADTELAIAGGFVADIGIVTRMEGGDPVIGIEALTIAEAPPTVSTPMLSRDARQVG